MPFHLANGQVASGTTEGLPTPSVGPTPPVFVPEPVEGEPGVNAYTRVTSPFTMPSSTGTVDVSVVDSSWLGLDQPVFIETAGTFTVSGVNSKTSITILNSGASANATPGTQIAANVKLSPSGYTGSAGDGSYLPVDAPPNGTTNTLYVSNLGVVSWVPEGGYTIETFSLSGTGVASTVEVGTSISSVNFSGTLNFTPTALTWTASGVVTESGTLSNTSSFSGTVTGPVTSPTNGAQLTVTIHATDPLGTVHTSSATITFAIRIVYGVVASPETAGQALWNTLLANASVLTSTRSATVSFTGVVGEDDVAAMLTSFGTPTLTDSATGFRYTGVSLGTATITENGTSQAVTFWKFGNSGSSFTNGVIS